ncbi:hypothetical protein niasHT_005769 [Heterodera trifolii]|uniref:Tyrosine-protein phosphatase domain-containing protein n=1 Tax=Heterodera trifolii TaxID=157864 RepID=A0ABD2M7W6_9BILA
MSGRSGRSGKRRQDGPGRPSRSRQQQHTPRGVQSAYEGPREPPEQPTVRGWEDTRDFYSALKIFVNETTRRNVKELVNEYTELNAMPRPETSPEFTRHMDCNRYRDVICAEQGRVRLDNGRYIHANWITALGETALHLHARPTRDDLRRLLGQWSLQENIESIVMLCDTVEQNKTKCHQYWPTPDKKQLHFANKTIAVHFIEETALEPDLYRTKLAVLTRNGTVYVHHFHWRRWPDRGVPQNDLAPLRLLFHVQQFRRSVESDGLETLVALHIAYDTLQRGQRLNILALARNLRQHRAQSVQTLDQYLYIYFVILRYAQNKAAKLNIDETRTDDIPAGDGRENDAKLIFYVFVIVFVICICIWYVVSLLLVGCGTILWFFWNNVKKRRRPNKKEIFISADCWLEVFAFLAPSQLGLGIALISRRFDRRMDEHFKTRKWKLDNKLRIQKRKGWNGPMKWKLSMPTEKSHCQSHKLRCPTNYIDQNVLTFLLRFRRFFASSTTSLGIMNENVCISEFILSTIWPMFHNSVRMMCLSAITFRRMRQLAPSMLSECPSLQICVTDNVFPEFPPDDSAAATDGQAVVKWLFTPRPDNMPKLFKFSVNSSAEEWSSIIEQFKAAFSNASSRACFTVFFVFVPSSSLDFVQDAVECVVLIRDPIVQDEIKWDKLALGWNVIDILIGDGGVDDGLLDASSLGRVVSSSRKK